MNRIVSIRVLVLTIFVLALALGNNIYGETPSPKAKQLKIGLYTYSGAVIWNDAYSWTRDWYANRYGFLMGAGGSAGTIVANMRTVNPELKALVYQLYLIDSSAATDIGSWCASMGYDSTDLLLHTGSDSGDSTRIRSNPSSAPDGFGRWVESPPNSLLYGPGYNNAQTRLCWDFREPKVGEYLAYKWKTVIDAMGYNGALVDEEFIIGYTNNAVVGNYCTQVPFRDITTYYWGTGSPYTSLQNNWGNAFDLQGSDADVDEIHSYVDVRDSLRRARAGWMKTAGDEMKASNYFYAPNFAAVPTSTYNNWHHEGRQAAIYAGAYIIGEYSYFYPSLSGYYSNCVSLIKACRSIKDEDVDLFVGWIRMGQYDRANGVNYARSKMNGLGLMLASSFPGTARYWFSPCVRNGQVDFKLGGSSRNLGGYEESDTLTTWSYAWTKYFGVPTDVRDTSITGNDGAGQSYKVWRFALMHPQNSNDTLTFVIGRLANGTNYDLSTTRVNVTLPSGTWYELKDTGVNTSSEASVVWEQITSGTVAIGNAEWRFFVKDVDLANNGLEGSGSNDSIPPAKIEGLGCEPGNSHGEIFLEWTATGDDSTTETAARYEILYSQSPIDPALFEAEDTVSYPPIPLPAEQPQSYTIGGLAPGVRYYVAIRAVDEARNVSVASLFNREFAGGIRPPDPITAEVDSSAGSAILTASMVESYYAPLSYQIAVDTNINLPTPLVTDGVPDGPSVSADFDSLSSEQAYFWRCRAIAHSPADSSDWSDPPAYFTLESGTTGYLIKSHLLSPGERELVPQNPPQFIVSAVPYVTAVFFQVDSDSTFRSPISSGPIPALADLQTIWSPSDSLETKVVSSLWWRASPNGVTWVGPVQFEIEPDLSTSLQSEAMTYAFPNPFRPAEVQTVTFADVPPGANLVILSTSGSVVRRWTNATAGVISWDGTNASGRAVASGVYLWFVENSDDRKGKLLVVR